jgi:uncharacterized membrane protein YsdA (DUF1294 family)
MTDWTLQPRFAAIVAVYAAMSMITFAAYAWDKHSARRGRTRVRERTLHTLELLGGWPGGLVAQQVLRHKRRKFRFYAITWLIVALHVAGWWVLWFGSDPTK